MKSIFHDTKIALEILKVADNETLTGTGVDMSGYEGVAFVAVAYRGEVAAVTLKAQQDSASNFGTAADLEGTSVAMPMAVGTDTIAVLDIYQPRERYVRPIMTVPNITTPAACAVISIRYNGRINPQTVAAIAEFHVSPAEGTA